jgi:hypothetical protein
MLQKYLIGANKRCRAKIHSFLAKAVGRFSPFFASYHGLFLFSSQKVFQEFSLLVSLMYELFDLQDKHRCKVFNLALTKAVPLFFGLF